ncbi:MAG: ABC transporter ATP-binding protein [Paracoccaceae bacterium]|nr:MAG: ABC transporter ATP-binding protein [Paracoccaceae bacterium]
MTLVSVRDLTIAFGGALALRALSFDLRRGELLGVVGESGSGKTLAALSLMGMAPEAARVSGAISFDGERVDTLPETGWQRLRGRRIAMIFQEPMSALNPLQRIGTQITEAMIWHEGISRAEADARALALLGEVGMPEPQARLRMYPHQLSGGQRQRALIAMALACNPDLVLADEPTTALDATRTAQALDLLRGLARARSMALILISHDLAAIERVAERMLVLYGGDLMEEGPVAEILSRPAHPYTAGLIRARPRPRPPGVPRRPLPTIPGSVPGLADLPRGCRFHGRCPKGRPVCAEGRPPLVDIAPGRRAACLFPEPV